MEEAPALETMPAASEPMLAAPVAPALPEVASPDLPLPEVAPPELALPEAPFPSLPGLPDVTPFIDSASTVIDRDMVPLIVPAVLLPIVSFALLLFYDAVRALVARVKGDVQKPTVPTPGPPEDGSVAVPRESFEQELSVWPALLEIQASLKDMEPSERRRVKLETGTNWPPRTPTERPFDTEREGYMFFQGPTPLTSVQPDLPDFFSAKNFEGMVVPKGLKVAAGVGGVAFLIVAALLILE